MWAVLPSEWKYGAAGCVAGLTTTVLLHPLDVIKTRMQVQDGHGVALPNYRGALHCMRSIVLQEGWRTLYAGLLPSLLGSGAAWGLYFLLYNQRKAARLGTCSHTEMDTSQLLMAGLEAGCMVSILTNPIWVIKTRLQLQYGGVRGSSPSVLAPAAGTCGVHGMHRSTAYHGLVDAMRRIGREEGIHAFYRGLGPNLLLVSHAAIQFAVYEHLKVAALLTSGPEKEKGSRHLGPFQATLTGGLAKGVASMSTYPFQVLRSRMMQRCDSGQPLTYGSTWGALALTVHREGLRGLYKGLGPNLVRVMPQSSLMFMVYEGALRALDAL
ncbi:unnamed protein product [Ostreobium quekettii]|uniref:Mitochondrial folate transporter/carrier n=1 Tax=Ostreobium quekettii TaxID=121088 RepID=A0A8S1IPH9_9CHLO|nr:unnamed protein product [Ostreobium quekettii]